MTMVTMNNYDYVSNDRNDVEDTKRQDETK